MQAIDTDESTSDETTAFLEHNNFNVNMSAPILIEENGSSQVKTLIQVR